MAWYSRSVASCGPVLLEDYGRTCFVDRHFLRGKSEKGFWWRPQREDLPWSADPLVYWPYWHDDDGSTADGAVDWTFRPVYCNGNFWGGLRRAFDGEWQPCGTMHPKGSAIVEDVRNVMDCCICPDMPWVIDVEFSGLQDFPDKTPRSGSFRVHYLGPPFEPCQWTASTTVDGVSGGLSSSNLSVTHVNADGEVDWSCTLLIGLGGGWSCADSFDLVADAGWLDNYGESVGSAIVRRVDHSGGCGGPFDYLVSEEGDLYVSDGDEAYVT